MKHDFLQVGKITNVHGIMGELRVEPWADSPDFLHQFKTLYLGDAHRPVQVLGARTHKSAVILKLDGIEDIDSALALRGQILSIARSDAQLPAGAFFIVDLIGVEARDVRTGVVLGKIDEVLSLSAHNVYVVRGGEREWMIPAVDQFVKETNIDAGFILVETMEGL